MTTYATAIPASTAVAVAGADSPANQGSATRSPIAQWISIVVFAAVGIVTIGRSYSLSAEGASPDLYYAVFWLGMLCAGGPVCALIASRNAGRSTRLMAILLFAFLTAVPKYLRNPSAPRFYDEYAHWREAVDVMLAGDLFRPSALMPIVKSFPGTSTLTEAARGFSGLSTWSAGLVLIVTMHVLGLFAVYVLAEVCLSSSRAAAIAVIVYAINPSAIYFHTQYAYESVGVNLFLWVIALSCVAAKTRLRGQRLAFLAASLLCVTGCVVTHHLSTLCLLAALGTVACTVTLVNRWRTRHAAPALGDSRTSNTASVWWIVFGYTALAALAWVYFVARPTLAYLSPYPKGSLRQLFSIPTGGGARELLAAQVAPPWEQFFAAAAPMVMGLVTIAAIIMWRRGRVRIEAQTLGIMAFGVAYFPSVLFILAPAGAEGARRSWGFSYIGLALIATFVITRWPSSGSRPIGRAWRHLVVSALLVTLTIGNVAAGMNDPYRFPGPFRWGTDTNSASDEARTVARLLGTQLGRVRIVSDRYTSLQLAAYGGFETLESSPGFPAWLLTQSGEDPPRELVDMLVYSEIDYLVVDVRMAEEIPFNGHNYGPHDPLRGRETPMEYLARLDSVPWAARVMATEHLRVYRLAFKDLLDEGENPR